MVRCSALMCYHSTYKKPPNVTFHKFPKETLLRNAWLKRLNRGEWQPSTCSVLCSEHFEAHLLDRSGFRTVLAGGAIPTRFKAVHITPEPSNTITESAPIKPVNILRPQINTRTEPAPINPVNILPPQINTRTESTPIKPVQILSSQINMRTVSPPIKPMCPMVLLHTGAKATNNSEKCAVCCCYVTRKTPGYEYYTFPCSADRRQQWLTAIGRPDFQPTRKSFVCSKHFIMKWSQFAGSQRDLLVKELPTLNLHEDTCPAKRRKTTHSEPHAELDNQFVILSDNNDINNYYDESRDPLGDSDTETEEEFKFNVEETEDDQNVASDVESQVGDESGINEMEVTTDDDINAAEDDKDNIKLIEENPYKDLESQFNIRQCSVVIENSIPLGYAQTQSAEVDIKDEDEIDIEETDVKMLVPNSEHSVPNITQVYTHGTKHPIYDDTVNVPKSINNTTQNNPMQEIQTNDYLIHQREPSPDRSPENILNKIRNYVNMLKPKTNFPNMEMYEKRLDGSDITYFISRLFSKYVKLKETTESQSRRIRAFYGQIRRRDVKIKQLHQRIKPIHNNNVSLPIKVTTSVTANEPRKIVQSVKTINNKLGILIESVIPNDNKSKNKRNELVAQNINNANVSCEPVIENIYIKNKVDDTARIVNELPIEQSDNSIAGEFNEIDKRKPRVVVQNVEYIYNAPDNDYTTKTDNVARKVNIPKIELKDRNPKIIGKTKIKTLKTRPADKESDIAIKNLILSESNTTDEPMDMPVIDDISQRKVVNKPIIVKKPILAINDNNTRVVDKPKTIQQADKEIITGPLSENADPTNSLPTNMPINEEISKRKIVTLPTMVVQRVETIHNPPKIHITKSDNIVNKPSIVKMPNLVLKRVKTDVKFDDKTKVIQNIANSSKVHEVKTDAKLDDKTKVIQNIVNTSTVLGVKTDAKLDDKTKVIQNIANTSTVLEVKTDVKLDDKTKVIQNIANSSKVHEVKTDVKLDDKTKVIQNIVNTSKVHEEDANDSKLSEAILPDSILKNNPEIDKRKMIVKGIKMVDNKPVIVLKNIKRFKLDNTATVKK